MRPGIRWLRTRSAALGSGANGVNSGAAQRQAPRGGRAAFLHSRPTRSGFTMVELLGVIVVLGMVAGTAAISWKSILPRTQLNSSVRALGSVLHGTRSDAVARNAEFRVVYDLDADKYWISSPFKVGGGLALDDEERLIYNDTSLPNGISFTEIVVDGRPYNEGRVQVRFTPMGTASDHTILLRQEIFERNFTIEVLALTGLIRFHQGIWSREVPRDGAFD